MVSKAIARFARISPRKARVVVDLVRGRQAGEALQLLEFTKKSGAEEAHRERRCERAHDEPGRGSRRALHRDRLRRQGTEQAHAPLASSRDGSRDEDSEGH